MRKERWKKAWASKDAPAARDYDYWHDIWIPDRQRMLDVFAFLMSLYQPAAKRILDIGGGTGAVTLRLLRDDKNIGATLVDGSQQQLKTAQHRFESKGLRCRFLLRDLNDRNWKGSLKWNYPLIVSNIAIHHLSNDRKRSLYKDIFELLKPGGLFIYGDLVRLPMKAIESQAYELWNHDIRRKFLENNLALKSVDWMKQKLMDAGREEGDRPVSIPTILGDLRRVGFGQVSLVWFYLKFAVVIGIKPEKMETKRNRS